MGRLGVDADYVIFGDGGKEWICGSIHSDAAVLFIRAQKREITSFAACSTSFLELEGRKVFSSPRALERMEWTRADGISVSEPPLLEFFDGESLRTGSLVP